MHTRVLLFALIASALVAIVYTQNPACAAETSCSTCGAVSGCAWCSSTDSCLDYSAATCTDNKWFTYPQCDACPAKITIDNGWGVVNAVPQPTVSITYNAGVFNFVVNASYLTENYAWTIDFESWDRNTRSIDTPNNCENRLASTFSGKTWADYWNAATFATSPNALNNAALPPYGPSSWGLTSESCGLVTYTRSFSFSDLVGCRGSTGNQLVTVTQVNGSNVIEYSGSLVVTAVKPAAINDTASGYKTSEFTYPFKFSLITYVNSMTSASQAGSAFVASVQAMSIQSSKLNIVIDGDLSSPEGMSNYITSPVVVSSPVPCSVVEGPTVLTPDTPCTVKNAIGQCHQVYTMTSDDVHASYGGQYVIQWTVVECTVSTGVCTNTGRLVTGTLVVSNTITGPTDIDTSFSSNLTLYSDNFAAQTNGPFFAGEKIIVKDQLNVAASDVDQFTVTINNAWVCYSVVAGQTPKYDPTNGQFGCRQPYGGVVLSSSIVQIVSNGVPTTTTDTQKLFATQIMAPLSHTNLPYYSTSALSFTATPITTRDTNYYIHIESTVATRSRRSREVVHTRRVMMNAIVSGLTEAAYIVVEQAPKSSDAISAGMSLVLLVIACIAHLL